MKPSQHKEIILYLEDTLKTFKVIKQALSGRNKTVRIKAMNSIALIVENRLDATVKYIRAGGYTALDINMTKGMYDPILQYLADEATK